MSSDTLDIIQNLIGLKFFESVEPSVKVHESKNRKIKKQIQKKEKKSIFLFTPQDLYFWC